MVAKGLESLIPKKEKNQQTQETSQKDFIFWIDIDKIKANPYQPRKEFDEEALNSLAESIKKYGILQPIIVHKMEKKTNSGIATEYQIIAGERRWRASTRAGLKQIPVIIKSPSNREKLEIALIENVQRRNLNPIDKAEAYDQLRIEFNLLEKEIAQVAGVSREAVSNALRMLSLPKEVREALKLEKITEGHAKALLAVKEEGLIKQLFKEILENNYSVRDVEKAAKGVKITKKVKTIGGYEIPNKDFFEKKLKDYFDHEKIKLESKKGKIQFIAEFDTENDLKNWIKKAMHK
ncbi:MAG: ParB/RepB/Spo0J family partition protein [Candidatus Paceibacterota bacterium]|jgi:ParB family chromosome partitioning protein